MSLATTITPFLTVKDAQSAFAFYVKAFGATISEWETLSNGGFTGKVTIDDASFWIGDEEPQFGNYSPKESTSSGARMILIVNNPETVFSNALDAGATQICPVTIEDSWKIGKLADPFGYIWEIGQPL